MKKFYVIQCPATDLPVGGGDAKTPPPAAQAAAPAKVEEAGSDIDELGYAIVKAAPEGSKEIAAADKKAEAKVDAGKETKIEETVAGYGVEIKAEEVAAPVKEEPTKVELGYELDAKDLDPKEALKIAEYAKKFSLPKEAAQALVDSKKADLKFQADVAVETQRLVAAEKAQVKANWYKELKSDPAFGGEKFEQNIKIVDKVLLDYMPGTKEVLTKNKSMLPPYVMRDLANLAGHLFGTEKLVNGGASNADKENENKIKEDDPLSFYT